MPIRLALDDKLPMSSTRYGSRLISPASYCTGSGTTMHPATPTGTGSCYPEKKTLHSRRTRNEKVLYLFPPCLVIPFFSCCWLACCSILFLVDLLFAIHGPYAWWPGNLLWLGFSFSFEGCSFPSFVGKELRTFLESDLYSIFFSEFPQASAHRSNSASLSIWEMNRSYPNKPFGVYLIKRPSLLLFSESCLCSSAYGRSGGLVLLRARAIEAVKPNGYFFTC